MLLKDRALSRFFCFLTALESPYFELLRNDATFPLSAEVDEIDTLACRHPRSNLGLPAPARHAHQGRLHSEKIGFLCRSEKCLMKGRGDSQSRALRRREVGSRCANPTSGEYPRRTSQAENPVQVSTEAPIASVGLSAPASWPLRKNRQAGAHRIPTCGARMSGYPALTRPTANTCTVSELGSE